MSSWVIRFRPASTKLAALSRSWSVKASSCGRAVEKNSGMPSVKPCARELSSSVPVCRSSGTRL